MLKFEHYISACFDVKDIKFQHFLFNGIEMFRWRYGFYLRDWHSKVVSDVDIINNVILQQDPLENIRFLTIPRR
jgi:hypothetical protein